MPASRRMISADDVLSVAEEMFTPTSGERFGIELEWPVHRPGDPAARPEMCDMVPLQRDPLPHGSHLTFEPGGQAELSTAPMTSVGEALRVAAADSRALGRRLLEAGYTRELLAVDTRRSPRRTLRRPRYAAMEAFFNARGPTGRWMMCNTASTQVNISLDPADPLDRWYTAHLIGPVLVAAFANSPGIGATGQTWVSTRQAIWWAIDPARTRPVRVDLDPAPAWAHYAMAADVFYINAGEDGVAVPPGMPFGKWLTDGHPAGWPTAEDLRYHLSTLFPPVRPRGWLELRMLDALPVPARNVAVLTAAAACTRDAGAELRLRIPDTSDLWPVAFRRGLSDPRLARGASILFDVVARHLPAVTAESAHADLVAEFAARCVHRPRSPHPGKLQDVVT